jgi:hypothetical protein
MSDRICINVKSLIRVSIKLKERSRPHQSDADPQHCKNTAICPRFRTTYRYRSGLFLSFSGSGFRLMLNPVSGFPGYDSRPRFYRSKIGKFQTRVSHYLRALIKISTSYQPGTSKNFKAVTYTYLDSFTMPGTG